MAVLIFDVSDEPFTSVLVFLQKPAIASLPGKPEELRVR
jgi:hypothetical protein